MGSGRKSNHAPSPAERIETARGTDTGSIHTELGDTYMRTRLIRLMAVTASLAAALFAGGASFKVG